MHSEVNRDFSLEELLPLITEVTEAGGEFRLHPRGTSMRPMLREGKDSVVLVRPDTPRKREIYLYRRASGQFVLHRLLRVEKNGTLTFCGDNQLYLERGIAADALIARVSAYYRGKKRISMASVRQRLYAALYCFWPYRWLRYLPRRMIQKIFHK
ncbi:MAG: S24/S26 family peptidase [Clostridia bacterium]|nr:S24/S26 family peptidase [Clostridia bacterium]